MTSRRNGKTRRRLPVASLPSVDELDAYIASCQAPPRLREIARAFGIQPQQRADLRRLLTRSAFAPSSEGGHSSGSVGLYEVVMLSDDGLALALPVSEARADNHDAPQPQIVSSARTAPAIGDRFLGKLAGDDEQSSIDLIRILPRAQTRMIGQLTSTPRGWMLYPVEKAKRRAVFCHDDPALSLSEGDLVEAIADGRDGFITEVRPVQNLGPVDRPLAFTHLAIAEYQLPYEFSPAALAQADDACLPDSDGRTEIRHLPLVTIDGEDAKDFDDAVYANPSEDGGWQVIVAIADVSHYVHPDTALDTEAQNRGNSVYLPGTVIPMLPEALSNGLCSLRPDEDRACLCVEFSLTSDGVKTGHRFFRGLMRSSARLTYTQVQQVLDGLSEEANLGVQPGVIHHLAGVYHCLKSARDKRGTLELNIAESKVEFDENNRPLSLISRKQTAANQLIEELMVMANICAAETLEAAHRHCVFRVHDRPDPEKLDGLFELTSALGLSFAKGQVISPKRLNQLLEHVRGTPAEMAINETVLRCQARAVYSPDNLGHYGLGLSRYAHFTSPIRRYSDLLVHRALVALLASEKQSGMLADLDTLNSVCAHISLTEQRAAKAERRTIARYAALLARDRLGSVLEVTVTGLVSAGLFVRLDDSATEGFIPRRTLPEDYYQPAEAGMALIGQHMGWRFAVGAVLEAKLTEIDAASASLTLSWRGGGERTAPQRKSGRGKNRHRQSRRRR